MIYLLFIHPQSKVEQKEEVECKVHLQCDVREKVLTSLNFTVKKTKTQVMSKQVTTATQKNA